MNKIKCADCRNLLAGGGCYMIWLNVAVYPTLDLERNCKWFVHKDTPIFPVVGFDSEVNTSKVIACR